MPNVDATGSGTDSFSFRRSLGRRRLFEMDTYMRRGSSESTSSEYGEAMDHHEPLILDL